MKKIFIYFLIIILVFANSGCSHNTDNLLMSETEAILAETENSLDKNETESETTTIAIVEDDVEVKRRTADELLIYDDSKYKTLDDRKIFNSIKEYPRVDGSTALIPYMQKLLNSIYGLSEEECEDKITCSKTAKAWKNLASYNADLLIVGEVPESAKETIEMQQTELLYSQIRNEGLVFIVNKDNPVNSIKKEDLIKIYTGEITNWKELGGEDKKIKAFQRNESSGSQTNFMKVLMKDIEPKALEPEYYVGDMGYLVDAIASFDGENNAIGYSVYYYANVMYTKDNLKFLAIDGVLPTNETIADGTYPLLTKGYVAIRKNEKEDSNTYKLYNYIRSNLGKEDLAACGYVPTK